MKILYSTQATAIGGRSGWVGSVDGALRVKLAKPEGLGGRGGVGGNPEHLFAAAYAASFLDALAVAAGETGQDLTDDANVTATVKVGQPADDPGLALSVSLSLDLPNLDRATAEALAERAHALCPYSRALRETMAVKTSVT